MGLPKDSFAFDDEDEVSPIEKNFDSKKENKPFFHDEHDKQLDENASYSAEEEEGFYPNNDEKFEPLQRSDLYAQNPNLFYLTCALQSKSLKKDTDLFKIYLDGFKLLIRSRQFLIDKGFAELKNLDPAYYERLKKNSVSVAKKFSITGAHSAMLLEALCTGPLYSGNIELDRKNLKYDLLGKCYIDNLVWKIALNGKEELALYLGQKRIAHTKMRAFEESLNKADAVCEKSWTNYFLGAANRELSLLLTPLSEACIPLFKSKEVAFTNWSVATLQELFSEDLQKERYFFKQLQMARGLFPEELKKAKELFVKQLQENQKNNLVKLCQNLRDSNCSFALYLLANPKPFQSKIEPHSLFLIRYLLYLALVQVGINSLYGQKILNRATAPFSLLKLPRLALPNWPLAS